MSDPTAEALPAGAPHTFQNALDEESKLLMPARPDGIHMYFAELTAEAAEDPGNAAALNAIGAKYGIEVPGPPPGMRWEAPQA